MNIVEYLDPSTKKPSGQYAKRFRDKVDVVKSVQKKDPLTGEDMFDPFTLDPIMENITTQETVERDEVIPKKIFCIHDTAGNIKSVTEINFSHAIEVEGKSHCMDLKAGEECSQIQDVDMPVIPEVEKKDKLKWLLGNHKMGPRDARGERKIKKKV